MKMLESLPQTSFTTATPWWAQPRKFTGPLLRDVLAASGGYPFKLKADGTYDADDSGVANAGAIQTINDRG